MVGESSGRVQGWKNTDSNLIGPLGFGAEKAVLDLQIRDLGQIRTGFFADYARVHCRKLFASCPGGVWSFLTSIRPAVAAVMAALGAKEPEKTCEKAESSSWGEKSSKTRD